VNILPSAEKQGELPQLGGWQEMARRRFQRGSIRKRGKRKPIWELQWWEDFMKTDRTIGRRRESVVLGYCSDMRLKQARKEAEKRLRPLNAGKLVPSSTLSVREFVGQFFVTLTFPVLKESTRQRYRSTLKLHLLPAFGDRRICDVSAVEVQRLILEKLKNGSSWETCHHLRSLLSKVFSSAKKWGYFEGDNPASAVSLPEKPLTREKRALMPEQVAMLLGSLSDPVRTMVLVAVLTGLRVGEILALRWTDVDLEAKQLRVEQAVYRGCIGTPKTKGSRRTLPLPRAATVALQTLALKPNRGGEELVFATRTGTAFNDSNVLRRHIKPAGRKAGVPWVSWYTFRRTHATLLQLAGGSPKDAQAQLGHSRITTTLGIYTIPVPSHQRLAVERLSELVTNGDEFGAVREVEYGTLADSIT
jgi:integrase